MDAANLYREEMITDRKMGVIHVLTPVTAQGEKDTARACIFTGEVQVMTQMGPLPISFEIKAANLEEAVKLYGEAAKKGVRLKRCSSFAVRRQARSSPPAPPASASRRPPARAAFRCPDIFLMRLFGCDDKGRFSRSALYPG